jgi:hypothetical protein
LLLTTPSTLQSRRRAQMQIDERPIKDTMKAYERGPNGWSVHGDYRTPVETIPTVGTMKHSSASHTDCQYNGSVKS